MTSQLTSATVDLIVRNCIKHNFSALRTQLDGVKMEMKVIRDEVKKMTWEIGGIKERLSLIESA